MSQFEQIIRVLQVEMNRPEMYGWFHMSWVVSAILAVLFLSLRKEKDHEKTLKRILFAYGVGSMLFELTKQIIWSYHYDAAERMGIWDYQWYAFPFQLCTTPIIISFVSVFLRKGSLRDCLLSYMAFITILGSTATAFYPEFCFVQTLMINMHTMYLH
ncbi:MAG: hypothetical protein IJ189_03880 [Clostridia bacterium]|nr:hypothetical protein [Clostridia bacterium]